MRAEADSKIDAIIRAAKEDHSNAKIVWENLMSKIIGVERMCSVLPTHESRINALDRTLNQLADELANDQEQNRLVQKALLDRIIKLESEQREAFQLIELNRQTIGNLTNTVEENNKVLRTLLNQQNAKVLEHVATNREELSNKVLSMETRLTAELDTVKQDLAVKEAMDFSALKSQCDDLTEFVENIQSHIDEQVDRVEHSIDGKMEKLQEMIAPKIELIHECQQEQLEQIVGIEGEVMSQIHNFDQALNVYFMQQEQLQQQLNLSTTTINNQILDIRNNYENINNSFSSLRNTGHDRLNSPTSSRRFPKVDRIDVSSPKVRGSRSPLARSGSNTPTRVSQLPRVFENRLGSPSFIRSSDDSNPKATTPKKIKLGTPTRANEGKISHRLPQSFNYNYCR